MESYPKMVFTRTGHTYKPRIDISGPGTFALDVSHKDSLLISFAKMRRERGFLVSVSLQCSTLDYGQMESLCGFLTHHAFDPAVTRIDIGEDGGSMAYSEFPGFRPASLADLGPLRIVLNKDEADGSAWIPRDPGLGGLLESLVTASMIHEVMKS